ncbi:MAG: class II aldolase/adducin family protein [Humidesulfovibrio sp.]|nr:class II aldolase/adducin family protein [Humidesulfovibrio sp.]
MHALLAKYAAKLAATGLCEPGDVLIAALDDELAWSRAADGIGDAGDDPRRALMKEIFAGMSISALLLARPSGAYQAAMTELARQALADAGGNGPGSITPGDCETRTFLHDLPVVDSLSVDSLSAGGIIQALRQRKGCVIFHEGETLVAAYGSVSPEQAYVTFSSMCFACFVAYFAGHLRTLRAGAMTDQRRAAFARVTALLPRDRSDRPDLLPGPFADEDAARAAMIQAGRHTVEYGLVDSYFGNISYLLPGSGPGKGSDIILISQTGSSLDELGACIDPCRMDGSSCAGLTASSEYSAHKAVYEAEQTTGATGTLTGGARAILHGHPRFSVILSLDCARLDCPKLGECHRACDTPRAVVDASGGMNIPIVPGEVGTGPFGLCNTLPQALTSTSGEKRGAIVYGHGLFTLGAVDFRDAFASLMDVEHFCRAEYFRRVAGLGG